MRQPKGAGFPVSITVATSAATRLRECETAPWPLRSYQPSERFIGQPASMKVKDRVTPIATIIPLTFVLHREIDGSWTNFGAISAGMLDAMTREDRSTTGFSTGPGPG